MGYYSQRLEPTMRINQKHEQEIVKKTTGLQGRETCKNMEI